MPRLLLLVPALLLLCPAVGAREASSFRSTDGVEIRYSDEGSGAPVLLIHGYRASGDMNWRFPGVIDRLADRFRVITIDNRGHGGSDKPESPEAYGRRMVDDAVALLDHLGLDSVHVVGYSMGGMITLRLLADRPERVRSALIGGMGWTRADEATRERYREPPANAPSPALAACYQGFADLGLTREELLSIERPMALVVGDRDGLYAGSVKPMLEVRPDLPLTLIEGADHASTVFRAEFRDAVRGWLDAQTEGVLLTTP